MALKQMRCRKHCWKPAVKFYYSPLTFSVRHAAALKGNIFGINYWYLLCNTYHCGYQKYLVKLYKYASFLVLSAHCCASLHFTELPVNQTEFVGLLFGFPVDWVLVYLGSNFIFANANSLVIFVWIIDYYLKEDMLCWNHRNKNLFLISSL